MTVRGRNLVWEECAWFPDGEFVALGDARLLNDETWRGRDFPFVHVRRSGYGAVYGYAARDGLPVEVGRRNGRGRIVACRLEFINDVAEVESKRQGRWESLGRLRIGDRRAIALDKKYQHLEQYAHRVPLRPAGTRRRPLSASGTTWASDS